MKKVRQSTVEPVLGTLINFLGLKRVNTRGIEQANKHVLMACIAYNLKKYMNYITRNRHTAIMTITDSVMYCHKCFIGLVFSLILGKNTKTGLYFVQL
jgi:hypothetical protein